jgi:ParB/RepB/Spo0J family partition protein
METIPVHLLVENELTNTLYTEDESFDSLIKSVEIHGILEPLLVQPKLSSNLYEVISGNRRLRASLVLGLTELPCIVRNPVEVDANLIMAHQEQRIKKPSEILSESVALYALYGRLFKQGKRKITNEVREARELRGEVEKKAGGKHMVKSLLKIDALINQLTNGNPELRAGYLKKLDKGKSIRGTTLSLERELADKKNHQHARESYDLKIGDIMVYNRSSEDVTGIEPNSVQVIFCSPPYLGLRKNGMGEDELGQEKSVADFVDRLCNHLTLYQPLLSSNGTMWVNLGDFVRGYGYEMVAERFALKMIDSHNWMLHDKIVWVKNNPVYTNSNRTVLANEFIFVFKKNDFVKFDLSWIREGKLDVSNITIGQPGGKVKLRSVFDFRENVIQTNVPNNHELSKACEAQGIGLTHTSTFPLSLPTIAILTCSEPGDLIIDPFSGTATTARSAQLFERRFVGFELNPSYQLQAEVRLHMPVDTDIERDAA